MVGRKDDSRDAVSSFGTLLPAESSSDNLKPWQCERCSFLNDGVPDKFCSMCGCRRRELQRSVQSVSGDKLSRAQMATRSENIRLYHPTETTLTRMDVGTGQDCLPSLDSMNRIPSHGSMNRRIPSYGSINRIPSHGSMNRIPSHGSMNRIPSYGSYGSAVGRVQDTTTFSQKELQMSFANWSISDCGEWTCVTCTYVNTNALHLSCEVCGQKRVVKTMATAPQIICRANNVMGDHGHGSQSFLSKQKQIDEMEELAIEAEQHEELLSHQSEMIKEFKHKMSCEEEGNPIDRKTVSGRPLRHQQNDHVANEYCSVQTTGENVPCRQQGVACQWTNDDVNLPTQQSHYLDCEDMSTTNEYHEDYLFRIHPHGPNQHVKPPEYVETSQLYRQENISRNKNGFDVVRIMERQQRLLDKVQQACV